MFQPSIGGTGLDAEELLVRFVGHPVEVAALFRGGLSLSQASSFRDEREGAHTAADDRWISDFFQQSERVKRVEFERRRQAILATAYVGCWHRLNESSEIPRLKNEYVPNGFGCLIATTVRRICLAVQPPDGTPMWLELFPVRYLADEDQTLEEVLKGELSQCGYPSLEFKRPDFAWEQEARFVMHDYSATMVHPGPNALLGIERPPHRYASVDRDSFIASVHPLNEQSAAEVQLQVARFNFGGKVIGGDLSNLHARLLEGEMETRTAVASQISAPGLPAEQNLK